MEKVEIDSNRLCVMKYQVTPADRHNFRNFCNIIMMPGHVLGSCEYYQPSRLMRRERSPKFQRRPVR